MQAHRIFYSLPTLLALAPLLSHADEQCWYPDGKTLAPDVPCNSDGSASACCNSDAFCLDNGLCLFQGIVSRGSCTDQTWTDPACAQYCRDFYSEGGAALQPCNALENTWACGTGNSDCINDQNTFTMSSGNGIVLRASQVASLQSGSSTAVTLLPTSLLQVQTNHDSGGGNSSDSTATQTVTASPSGSSAKFTAGDMAGVGAGVGVPLLLALLGALFVIRRQRKRLKPSQSALHNELPPNYSHGQASAMQNGYGPPSRSAQSAAPYIQAYYKPEQARPVNELDGLAARQELAGDHRSEMK